MATATIPLLNNLTPGERLFIWRHRRGLSQSAAAKQMKTTCRVYSKWERDENTNSAVPHGAVRSELTKLEQCLLLRRRDGMLQSDLARRMDFSTGWVKALESGRSTYEDSLHAFWGV